MDLFPISKSTYKNFLTCPWRAHAIHNLKLETEQGDAAALGVEVHDLLAGILTGATTVDQACEKASSDEVRDLVRNTVTVNYRGVFEPPGGVVHEIERIVEQDIHIDEHGQIVAAYAIEAIAHGFTDLMVLYDDDSVLVPDWKTGRWEKGDDVFERDLYVQLAKSTFPNAKVISFVRYFNRSQTPYEWTYDFTKKHQCVLTNRQTMESVVLKGDAPILERILANVRAIRQTAPDPREGPHCKKMYGRPCDFYRAECPLSLNLPMVAEQTIPEARPVDVEALRLVATTKKKDDIVQIPESVIAAAHHLIIQCEAVQSVAKKKIKQWAEANGPFNVLADDSVERWGWNVNSSPSIDVAFALEVLLDIDKPRSEIAQAIAPAVSITEAGLKKLPDDDEWLQAREMIMSLGVKPKESRSFGLIEDVKQADQPTE